MKKNFLYTALFALMLASCSEQEVIEQPSTPTGGTEVQLPADVTSGELLIKFDPAMTEILDQALTVATRSGGAMTRSGIPSTDEVLDILGTYHFERIFPVDTKNEERTRTSGLHLWYRVKFDENTDLKEAAGRLAKLGEVAKVQANSHIQRAYRVDGYRSYVSESALRQKAATRTVTTGSTFSDPGLAYQWHYNNSGNNPFDNQNVLKNGSRPGCDVERTAGFSELDKQRVYLLGVDVAVDEYIGELIAVARRRDDPETVWIIAPENISYTIQQIEEMIYFEEQYYDSFVEIVDEELWDAYDENEKLLGFDLKRSQAKSLPDGVYHVIVNVYTMTKDGKLLTTERSRNKTYPLKWEVTGGSILKGETAAEGAVRELYEETGIKISTEDLIVLYSYVDKPKHAIYHSYLNLIEKEVHVTLQEGETMDYMYVPYKEFDELVNSDRFVPSEQRRYKNQAVFTMLSRFIPDSAAST